MLFVATALIALLVACVNEFQVITTRRLALPRAPNGSAFWVAELNRPTRGIVKWRVAEVVPASAPVSAVSALAILFPTATPCS